ncbi:MAG: D-glycero-beta-D-manno-heptose 1,7-bisphosphate 7-phosphatase [Calditrichaeota bacterium]|nr:D-glycero-beta-D-manno-heptose 1,7-bisphosphate 7-phosphatase [Calditrichota bacterium]
MAKHPPKQPAAFLDRDGTLNVDVGYPDSLEKIVLIPGAVEAVQLLNRAGYAVVVVSNQSGVARGYFDEARVQAINRGVAEMFAQAGARIDGFYYCPHLPEAAVARYRRACGCRKPAPGMLQKAVREMHLDLARSLIIGDKYSDIAAGKALGLQAVLVRTGEGPRQHARYGADDAIPQPDYIADDVLAAVRWLLKVV